MKNMSKNQNFITQTKPKLDHETVLTDTHFHHIKCAQGENWQSVWAEGLGSFASEKECGSSACPAFIRTSWRTFESIQCTLWYRTLGLKGMQWERTMLWNWKLWNTRATTKCLHPYLQTLVTALLSSMFIVASTITDKYWKVSIWSECEEWCHICETVAAHKVELLKPPPSARNTSQISKKPPVSCTTHLLSQLSQKGWN